jgi:CHAT domain-containing protein/tetratricopeptide (TPR) repeat protein
MAAASHAPAQPPTADDAETSRAAAQAMAEAAAQRAQGSADSNQRALELYAEAARLWGLAGDRPSEAAALEGLGVLLTTREVPRAREVLTRALSLAEQAGDEPRKASVRVALGSLHLQLRETKVAREHLETALPLTRALGDVALEARALSEIAACLRYQGEPAKAREAAQEAIRLARQRGNVGEEARGLHYLGLIHGDAGEMQPAFEALRRAVALHREAGDRAGEAAAVTNLGYVHETAGDYARALEHYEEALALARAAGDRSRVARSLNLIGWIHYAVGFDEGDDAKGLSYFREAAQMQRQTGDVGALAYTLNSTAALLQHRKDIAGARAAAEEAFALAEKTGSALIITRQTWTLASIRAEEGRDDEARALFARALDGFRSAGSHHNAGDVLCDLAAFLRERGDLEEARARIEEAIALLEEERSSVAGEDLRAAYLESHRYYYNLHMDVLMALHARQPARGLDALALSVSERARARGLLETLAQARVGLTDGVDPGLIELERDRRARLSAKERERAGLVGTATGDRSERLAAVERELQALVGEYREIQERLRLASPGYAALTLADPLSTAEIQRELLDDDTLLLEYALGEKRSFVWAVTRDAVRSHELPASKTIEAVARRVHETFAQSHRRAFRGPAEVAAAELSRMVLGPVADLLGDRRLVVVAEGALLYVPPGALPHPARGAGGPPLIDSREVVQLPSASSLAMLRRDLAGRRRAGKLVAVLSDPVFDARDPRVRRAGPAEATPARPAAGEGKVTRAAAEAGLASLDRLRYSRREAEAIAALAPPEAAMKAVDFAASRATATGEAIRDYRIVHFATHGLLNSRHPELTGIVLSLVDEHGRPVDGFLRLSDLYTLQLGADLVVLSACQTALGKQIKGEGLIGLTRGFFYAGAPRVIASLWSVRDEATSELMARFYRALLEGGQSPAAALRSAQVSLAKDPRWRAPYYWAGFVLQGEWKKSPAP